MSERSATKPNIVCIASYEKGQPFLKQLAAEGCTVILLTAEKLRDASWPWECITEMHAFPDLASPEEILKVVQRVARRIPINRVVALDEFDLEAAALVREDMRLPGMGQTTTRHFRDKLAMRVRARQMGVLVPDFIAVQTYADMEHFLRNTRGPWLLKPRTSAAAIGIRTIREPDDLWRALDELGDLQSNYLLECFVTGGVFHVDSVCWNREVLLQGVHEYGAPPMSLMHGGGVFTTRTMRRESREAAELRQMDAETLAALGMVSGVTHSEYIRGEQDGRLYFLETAARVGGAFIAEVMEFASGVNPWREWARIEAAIALRREYVPSPAREAYAGSLICLARQEWPDLSTLQAPEVVLRISKKHHAGLIVASESSSRVEQLLNEFQPRFKEDFLASLPPPDRPTS